MKTRVLLVCVLLVLCTGFAGAEESEFFYGGDTEMLTPDGLPPSVEDVCDGETGAAFGLCNAFCEAMDCDSGAPQASQKACDRVAANYEKHTGGPPPCGCPCVGAIDGWLDALNGEFGLQACVEIVTPGFSDFVALITEDPVLFPGSQAFTAANLGFCGFAFGSGAFLQITVEEAEQCNALVRRKADDAGLECMPI